MIASSGAQRRPLPPQQRHRGQHLSTTLCHTWLHGHCVQESYHTFMPELSLLHQAAHKKNHPATAVVHGPGYTPFRVLHKLNHQVFIVESVAVEHVRSFAVQCLHRFASSDLGNTEQIWMDIARDHRDNVIQKLTGHRFDDDLWFKVRWIGFTATRDTWQRVIVLAASCPDRVLQYYRQPCARRTPERVTFVQREFPTADYNVTLFQSVTVTRQRDFPTRMRRRTRKNFEFL